MPANAEQQEPVQRLRDQGALDVHSLMNSVNVRSPDGMVMVKGIVQALRPSPNADHPVAIYGDLRDRFGQSVMSFCCPPGEAPSCADEHVVLRGTLRTKISKYYRGFDLELVGTRVEAWVPEPVQALPAVSLQRERPKVSLERFVSKGTATRLLFLGTDRAIQDAKNTFSAGTGPVPDTKVISTELAELQAAITEGARNHDGICLLRGGGDPKLFTSFNDPALITTLLAARVPFYTAVGHATDLTLADKYADESFVTPSALGSACANAWRARMEAEKLRSDSDKQLAELRELKAEMARRGQEQRRSALDRNIGALTKAMDDLQQLPGSLARETSRAIETSFRSGMPQRGGAQNRATRLLSLTSLSAVFLLGALAGSLGYYLHASSSLAHMQQQLEMIQQQTALPHPTAAPNLMHRGKVR